MQSHMLIFKKCMSKLNSMKMQVAWSIKHLVNLTVSSPGCSITGNPLWKDSVCAVPCAGERKLKATNCSRPCTEQT